MPRPSQRTTSLRRVKKKSPSGKPITHYYPKKPAAAKCSHCGKQLHGIPRNIPSKIRKLPLTKKRPTRPFGGMLCSSCTREQIKIINTLAHVREE